MVSPPRVAMNGARRAYPTNIPLNIPSNAPTARAAIIASAGGHSATENPAASAPLKASTDPTERSIPPARITVVIPKASRALTEICRRTLIRFVVARKLGDSSDSASTRATRARAMPYRESHSRHLERAGYKRDHLLSRDGGLELGDHFSPSEDQDPVAEARQLLRVARRHHQS